MIEWWNPHLWECAWNVIWVTGFYTTEVSGSCFISVICIYLRIRFPYKIRQMSRVVQRMHSFTAHLNLSTVLVDFILLNLFKVFLVFICESLYVFFVLFHLLIILSDIQFKASVCSSGIFKLFYWIRRLL